ncbi:MAG: hypothetical protein H6581_16925 [Bacteroidia bacterium]|nr:hypothetical protein [Bacteroidia bacterium]
MKPGRHLFWDSSPEQIDPEKHARQIIERVVTRGSLEDWFEIRDFYGWERMAREVVKIRSLDLKTLIFLSTIFHIPVTDFRCYRNEPLNLQHSPF